MQFTPTAWGHQRNEFAIIGSTDVIQTAHASRAADGREDDEDDFDSDGEEAADPTPMEYGAVLLQVSNHVRPSREARHLQRTQRSLRARAERQQSLSHPPHARVLLAARRKRGLHCMAVCQHY